MGVFELKNTEIISFIKVKNYANFVLSFLKELFSRNLDQFMLSSSLFPNGVWLYNYVALVP